MNNETSVYESTSGSAYSAKEMRKSSNGNSLMLFVFLVCMIGGAYLSQAILGLFIEKDTSLFSNLTFLMRMLFQYFAGVPLAIFIYRKTTSGRTAEKIGSLFCKPQQSLWWIIRWIFITLFFTYAAAIANNLFFNLLQSLTNVKLNQISFSADNTLLSKVSNIIAIVFLAPFFEELLMRGALLGNSKRYGTWSAVISTGIFFGLLHANYPQIFFAAVMGICSAFLVLKTKSIIPSIIVHFIVNTFGGIQSLFIGDLDITRIQSMDVNYIMNHLDSFAAIMVIGLIIMGLMTAGLIFFILEIVMHKESFRLAPVCPEVSEKKKLGIYFTAPLTILLTLVLLVLTVKNALF